MDYKITTPRDAVKYAQSTAYPKYSAYPRIIHLNKDGYPMDGLPLQSQDACAAVIIVRKRNGDCNPTSHDIQKAYDSRKVIVGQGISFVDNIIIGDNGFYSFAEEKLYI